MSVKQTSNNSIPDEMITFSGHRNILATHRNTIELTKDPEVSSRGDCIIGVRSSKACYDISPSMKAQIQNGSGLEFEIRVDEESFRFKGRGHGKLILSSRTEFVLRKSDFLSDRTAAISCSVAAIDIPRNLISKLQTPSARGILIMRAVDKPPKDEFQWTLP